MLAMRVGKGLPSEEMHAEVFCTLYLGASFADCMIVSQEIQHLSI